jgi:hypothetical protein
MIYLCDSDRGGYESVQDKIDAGLVTRITVNTYKEFEAVVFDLLPKVSAADTFILDTITSLAETTRGDMKMGNDPSQSLWDKHRLYFGDKDTMNSYSAAQNMIMRPLMNLRARDMRIIVTAHEDEGIDAITQTKKRAPKLNPAFYDGLMAAASDVFRLSMYTEDVLGNDNTVKIKAGTRVLYLKASHSLEGWVAKSRNSVDVSEKMPKAMANPTIPKIEAVLQKRPGFLVLYGAPGCGKTTLSCSGEVNVAKPKEQRHERTTMPEMLEASPK